MIMVQKTDQAGKKLTKKETGQSSKIETLSCEVGMTGLPSQRYRAARRS
jgi:hypothetical protein